MFLLLGATCAEPRGVWEPPGILLQGILTDRWNRLCNWNREAKLQAGEAVVTTEFMRKVPNTQQSGRAHLLWLWHWCMLLIHAFVSGGKRTRFQSFQEIDVERYQ